MNELTTQAPARNEAADVVQHTKTIQEVMRSVMKPNVHYGTIPGAGDKPTLLKPGAEVLCMTFRIADDYDVQELPSRSGEIRYRVKCTAVHQVSGATLGSGLGECSTDEEKYKWRKAVSKEEWESTPENMRRVKFGRSYKADQVRTEPADLANTVLKMACKRAKIAMVLNVTAASDMFTQDLEELDAELVKHLAGSEREEYLQTAREDLANRAMACANTADLTRVFKEGKQTLGAMRDIEGFKAFSAQVAELGKALKAAEAKSAEAAPEAPEEAANAQ